MVSEPPLQDETEAAAARAGDGRKFQDGGRHYPRQGRQASI